LSVIYVLNRKLVDAFSVTLRNYIVNDSGRVAYLVERNHIFTPAYFRAGLIRWLNEIKRPRIRRSIVSEFVRLVECVRNRKHWRNASVLIFGAVFEITRKVYVA